MLNQNHGPAAVWLYRHGPLAIHKYQCVGWSDVPLEDPEKTAREARQLAAFMREPVTVYSSDLLRVRQTATPLVDALGLQARWSKALRELNFGEWEGRLWTDLHNEDAPRFAEFMRDWRTTSAPGGESFSQVQDRVADFWAEVAATHRDEVIVLVSHGGTLAALAILLLGWTHERAMERMLERGHFGLIDFRRGGYAWNFSPAKLPPPT